ncbi:ABC-type transport auxiliary lipoprotein family protein [Qipengyuania nanhaisediminis]|uniref:ABC-type transport auxiliary lipoprotein family protein n=1 Tax=Qipengyuania nanhaisediminis TaxID=604088 RepID=UPI0038B3DA23
MKTMRNFTALAALGLALGGCISLGSEPPESLITLSPIAGASGDAAMTGTSNAGAIAVLTPEVPAKLNVTRVPVHVSDTEIAYLQDAVWVEKPSRLFRRLLGETLRMRGAGLVLDTEDTPTVATRYVRGTLLDMGYDAPSSSVVVRFDAMRTEESGAVTARRFEARESGIAPDAASVAPALNRAANRVAGEVADWVIGGA